MQGTAFKDAYREALKDPSYSEDKVQLLSFLVSLGMQMDSILHLTFVHSRGIFVRVPLESKYLYWVTVCAQASSWNSSMVAR